MDMHIEEFEQKCAAMLDLFEGRNCLVLEGDVFRARLACVTPRLPQGPIQKRLRRFCSEAR